MMNLIFLLFTVISIVFSLFNGSSSEVSSSIIESGTQAVTLCLRLLGMMCLWNGIMAVADKSGLCAYAAKLLSPIIGIFMPGIKNQPEIKKSVSMNITANMLGLGNSATPLGIEAMRRMRDYYGVKEMPSSDMIAFVVLNTASLRIIPTTSMMMRQSAGAAEPADIIFCVWVSSVCSLAAALSACKICERVYLKWVSRRR